MKYGHHDARGNCEFIADELDLIEHHLSGKNVRCPECLVKHGQTVRAYATEGLALDHSNEVMPLLMQSAEYGDKLVMLISSCATGGKCEIRDYKDLINSINAARQLRRKLNQAVYGLSGDLVYESEGGGHGHTHTHGHRHELLGHEHVHTHEQPNA